MPEATGAAGKSLEAAGGLVVISNVYGQATLIDGPFFTAARAYRVTSIIVRPLVVGSDGGAVTLAITKAGTGVAATDGTALHASTADLKGTINTNQVLALSATTAALNLAAGDSLCMSVGASTTTAAKGHVSVELVPLA